MSLKLATYNVHGWYDGDGYPNLGRILDLYRNFVIQQCQPCIPLPFLK
jgi:hypothetical protein